MSALTIDRPQLRRLERHAREGYPHEVVGVLAGVRDANHVTRVHPLINERTDSPRNRYRVDGLTLMRAEQALEREGLEIVGYYHSHPDHPAQYSTYDRDHALPNMSYLIVSVTTHGVADALCWRLRDDRSAMDPEPIVLTPSGEPMSTVHIPTPLRSFVGGASSVEVSGATVGEALDNLIAAHSALGVHLRDDQGRVRSFVNVYLGDEDIRHLSGLDTALSEGAELTIVPSIAGGQDGLPELNNDEIARYSRHLILDEVGMVGQRRLKAGSVLCVGTGGLGSPLLMYLAAAGVGQDRDRGLRRRGPVQPPAPGDPRNQQGRREAPRWCRRPGAHARTSTRTCRWTSTRSR